MRPMPLLAIVMSVMIRAINGVQGGSQSGLKSKIELMNGHFPGQSVPEAANFRFRRGGGVRRGPLNADL